MPQIAESSYFRDRAIRKNKTAAECLETSHLSGSISLGDLIVRLFIKNMFFYKYWNRLRVKNKKKKYCQTNKY